VTVPGPGNNPPAPIPKKQGLAALSLAALGVVYGDIGTSPLYAIKETFHPQHGLTPTPAHVLGVLSLIFWAITLVISIKYVSILLRADNRGEGGVLALLALVRGRTEPLGGRRVLILLGLFAAALLYGEGAITPVMSLFGALEGVSVATPVLKGWIVPITLVILAGLFFMQKRGTAGLGRLFGPVMLVWFGCLIVFGLINLAKDPGVLRAVWPGYAIQFFAADGLKAFLVLGAVVLVITGGEALYADLGHFGPRPIRVAWFTVVAPALLINYFGQGALVLSDPSAVENPFYRMVPEWFLYPMVIISVAAACVASQALISGAFSLTRQAVQLGYSPRVRIIHTSHHEEGQIYSPEVNWALFVACVLLSIGFQNTTNLSAAYGLSVTGTMAVTSILLGYVARTRWHWPIWLTVLVIGALLTIDLSFFSANLPKIPTGGWFSLTVGVVLFAGFSTWKLGRRIITETLREGTLPLDLFIQDLERKKPVRVPGVAVFMTSDLAGAPPVLLHHLKHNKVLHERVIVMSVAGEDVPVVPAGERLEYKELGAGVYTVEASYGFMESPNVPDILAQLGPLGLPTKLVETSFFLGRETIIPTPASRAKRAALKARGRWMAGWRKRLFVVMARNAQTATAFFGLPPNRVVELGAQVQI
jgi:KUP system potassium uptake protein